MKEFDQELRQRAAKEPFPLPEDYEGRVFQTCSQLPGEMKAVRRRPARWTGWAAAAVLALCVLLPNASPSAAAALEEVPFLGALVRIVTFRHETYAHGNCTADVETPVLDGSEAAETVSEEVAAYTKELMEQFRADCDDIGESYQSLDVSSTVMTDTDTWFTLRVDALEVGASGYEFSRFYHIDKITGQTVTLADLFRPDADYVSVLSEEVLRQMEEQMQQDNTLAYFPEKFTGIDPQQNFYWNTDGELVLVFDEYTIAAGFMGMPEFVIKEETYQNLLK